MKADRVLSLDAFRCLAIILMLLTNNQGDGEPCLCLISPFRMVRLHPHRPALSVLPLYNGSYRTSERCKPVRAGGSRIGSSLLHA